LFAASQQQPGSLIILDLGRSTGDPTSMIRALKAGSPKRAPLLVGFYSHVDKELERRAREAGCDLVLPKSAFTKRLADILVGKV